MKIKVSSQWHEVTRIFEYCVSEIHCSMQLPKWFNFSIILANITFIELMKYDSAIELTLLNFRIEVCG